MSLHAWLRLGRVSNLPTVWTNVGAAVVLAGAGGDSLTMSRWIPAGILFSAFYVGGMVLNDAFDATFDARTRPTRPIPAGDVSARAAFVVSGLLLGVGVVGVAVLSSIAQADWLSALGWATALAACIVAYDAYHKTNPASPLLMGACRGLVFLAAAAIRPKPDWTLVGAAALLQTGYVVGLTYAAKQEDLKVPGSWWPLALLAAPAVWIVSKHALVSWPGAVMFGFLVWLAFALRPLFTAPRRIGIAVGRLIAAIAWVDAMLLASTGAVVATCLALAGVGLTRVFQRYIPGT